MAWLVRVTIYILSADMKHQKSQRKSVSAVIPELRNQNKIKNHLNRCQASPIGCSGRIDLGELVEGCLLEAVLQVLVEDADGRLVGRVDAPLFLGLADDLLVEAVGLKFRSRLKKQGQV